MTRCPTHKRYKGKGWPRSLCRACLFVYEAAHLAIQREHAEMVAMARAELRKDCSHERVVEYQWEHDNGYGRQSQCTGQRCTICDRKWPWGRR